MAQRVKNPPAIQETWVQSLGWEDSPREGNGNLLQYKNAWEISWTEEPGRYSPWGHKELDTT